MVGDRKDKGVRMKLKCEIEISENYTYQEKFDAMARAARDESLWKEVKTLDEIKKRTSLENKCRSCVHFCQFENSVNGLCDAGRCWGQRTRPKCLRYERKENG